MAEFSNHKQWTIWTMELMKWRNFLPEISQQNLFSENTFDLLYSFSNRELFIQNYFTKNQSFVNGKCVFMSWICSIAALRPNGIRSALCVRIFWENFGKKFHFLEIHLHFKQEDLMEYCSCPHTHKQNKKIIHFNWKHNVKHTNKQKKKKNENQKNFYSIQMEMFKIKNCLAFN